MINFNSFSQTDTSQVVLKTEVARKVIKDLIEGDAAKKEVVLLKEVNALQVKKIGIQESIIENQTTQILNLEQALRLSDEQRKQYELIIQDQTNSIRNLKFQNILYKGATGATLLLIGALLIQ